MLDIVAGLSFGQRRKKTKMSAGTSSSFCLIVCFLVCSSGAQKIITAELGQEVVLPCKVPKKNNIIAVKWIRSDRDQEYVLLYRDGHFDPYNQHPSYKNRVDLQDKGMKNGDVSLVLKDVKMEDTGKYKCRVYQRGKKYPIRIINLEVLPSAQTNITAELGQEVILPCKVPKKNNIKTITTLQWIRSRHEPDYVLVFQDGRFDPENQHPSYQNRVDLQDEEMKNGNVSLILKDVMKEDTGKYECYVFHGETNRRKRSSSDPIYTVNLEVLPSGNQLGIGAIISIVLAVLAVLAVISGLIYKKYWKKNPKLSASPDESTAVPMLPFSSSAAKRTTTSETLMEPAEEEQSENVN